MVITYLEYLDMLQADFPLTKYSWVLPQFIWL